MWNYEENYDEKPLWMATGTLPAGKKPTDPYPQGNSQIRTRIRNPRRVKNYARTRYPWVLYARGYTRVPARTMQATIISSIQMEQSHQSCKST